MFEGNIGMVGEVYKALTKKGESASFLIIDCGENSCKTMPVAYKGERPAVGSKIIVYGEIEMYKGQ